MSKGTERRSFRVEGPLWGRAKEVAAAKGDNLSDILRGSLEQYVRGYETSRPEELGASRDQ